MHRQKYRIMADTFGGDVEKMNLLMNLLMLFALREILVAVDCQKVYVAEKKIGFLIFICVLLVVLLLEKVVKMVTKLLMVLVVAMIFLVETAKPTRFENRLYQEMIRGMSKKAVRKEQHSQQQKNFLTVYNDAVFSEEVA